MRLDARAGDTGWYVFHVPTCRQVRFCVWVDDELAQYGAWASHAQCVSATLESTFCGTDPNPPVHQAKRILIVPDRRIVLIDPIEDDEPESVADVIAAARGVPVEG